MVPNANWCAMAMSIPSSYLTRSIRSRSLSGVGRLRFIPIVTFGLVSDSFLPHGTVGTYPGGTHMVPLGFSAIFAGRLSY